MTSTILTKVNKLDSASSCTKQSGEPGHVDVVGSVNTIRLDVVGSVNTIRLRRYGWNTSTEGSLRRKIGEKEENE